ncbi:MAG: hypothetical protein LBU23_05695 [Planctomycetota bacterium]|jgi:hypothetical protein|nr:hypothetical protein [Planctomycetota bacterium]
MKRDLKSIARDLSENEIQELFRLKKQGGRKVIALRKKREKAAAALAKLDRQIAAILGDEAGIAPTSGRQAKAGEPRSGKRRGRRSGTAAKAAVGKTKTAAAGEKKAAGKRRYSRGLAQKVRDFLGKATEPLNSQQIVEGLVNSGVRIGDGKDLRRRVGVMLSGQGKYFEKVGRGLYKLKE